MTGRENQKGFTIIETMLVLGISGLMLVGIIASVGSGLAVQRYKDSVNSLVDYLQGQYSRVTNVSNPRGSESYCTAGGLVESPVIQHRATTECTIVGRVLRGSGMEISATPVYATVDSDTLQTETDALSALIKSNLVEDESQTEDYTLEWGARMFQMGSPANDYKFSTLIIRSPFSGAVNTFVDTSSISTPLNDLLKPAALTNEMKMCVDAGGGVQHVMTSTLGVRVGANNANSSGVALLADGGGC